MDDLMLWILIALGAALVGGLVIMGVDYAMGETRQIEVVVIEKVYTPAKTGVGVGSGITTDGKIGTGIVTVSESEDYILIVKTDENEVFSKSVDAKTYADAKEGERLTLSFRFGGFTKTRY